MTLVSTAAPLGGIVGRGTWFGSSIFSALALLAAAHEVVTVVFMIGMDVEAMHGGIGSDMGRGGWTVHFTVELDCKVRPSFAPAGAFVANSSMASSSSFVHTISPNVEFISESRSNKVPNWRNSSERDL